MNLIPHWGRVLRHAWSIRLIALSALLSGLEVAVPFLDGLLPVSPGVFAALAALSTIAAGIARFVAQASIDPPEEPRWENGDDA